MSQPQAVVVVEDVWKRYRLWHERRQTVKEMVLRRGRGSFEDFWALRGMSFEVERGETFGLIGANGSGKSTMLKILTGILKADRGLIECRGRVSALLELGAGFHPELTGRENVFLNGSILGIPRRQITKRLDSIISFAGLEEFIDSPIRSYSSGMYIRLGFSVAVHSDPDLLLVDEVLAVGDEEFQRKSGERILQIREQGTTIILVSHNLNQVRGLCSRALWVDHGEVQAYGPADNIVDAYLRSIAGEPDPLRRAVRPRGFRRVGTGDVLITDVEIYGEARGLPPRTGGAATVRVSFNAPEPVLRPVFGIGIYRSDDTYVTGPNTRDAGFEIDEITGEGYLDFSVDRLPILPGDYVLSVAVSDPTLTRLYDHHDRLYAMQVRPGDNRESRGLVSFPATWSLGLPQKPERASRP